ncbi:rCG55308 [Rattus norvegicus]|uniref:RCG55308 n=1 Tax=Rattus norvegicus TaxID=10116 RepID=A6KF29_RAT|nr:rCG55308 [Rattus norvegicus]
MAKGDLELLILLPLLSKCRDYWSAPCTRLLS